MPGCLDAEWRHAGYATKATLAWVHSTWDMLHACFKRRYCWTNEVYSNLVSPESFGMKEANKGGQMWPANNLASNENVRFIIGKTEALDLVRSRWGKGQQCHRQTEAQSRFIRIKSVMSSRQEPAVPVILIHLLTFLVNQWAYSSHSWNKQSMFTQVVIFYDE